MTVPESPGATSQRLEDEGEGQTPADTASAHLATIWPLLGRHIAFHRRLVDLTGNVKAALLLSQAVYWTRHGRGYSSPNRASAAGCASNEGLVSHGGRLGFLLERHPPQLSSLSLLYTRLRRNPPSSLDAKAEGARVGGEGEVPGVQVGQEGSESSLLGGGGGRL